MAQYCPPPFTNCCKALGPNSLSGAGSLRTKKKTQTKTSKRHNKGKTRPGQIQAQIQNNEILTKQIAARPWVVLEVELGGGWGAAVGEFSRGIRRLATNAFRVIFSAFLPLLVLICPAVRQQCPILGAFPRCPVVEGSRRCWVSADAPK